MDSSTNQFPTRTVLLVDDDALLRCVLAEALAHEGYSVLTAKNGEEALALASTLEGQLGLLITDIRMPAMDGLELASNLAILDPAVPVLFTSAFCGPNVVIPGPVLTKPFAPATFLRQVGRMLNSPVQRA